MRLLRLQLLLVVACAAPTTERALAPSSHLQGPSAGPGRAVLVQKVLTMDGEDRIFVPGMILTRAGVIEYVGSPVEVPAGYELIERPDAWAHPGMVDLHTHIHAGGWGDINDMVQAVNPELRSSPVLVPGNRMLSVACASGVTTLFGIPGSGTNIGGFGVLYKSKLRTDYNSAVLAGTAGMKVAQDSNPQRRSGDFGLTRAGMGWVLSDVNDRAVAALKGERFDLPLENLKRIHSGELPVLIHTAGSDGVVNTARMWRVTYDTRSILSHGSWDGYKAAPALAEMGIPVNHGPRTTDVYTSRNGRWNASSAAFVDAGVPLFSLNTDSPVIPQEEFFVQGAMSARWGADGYAMLRALTIHPAQAFGIEARVGSLEPGKDADIVLRTGDPLDPRSAVDLVLIDGSIEYDRERDGQWF
ncbi:MAG: hypothetical protein CMJ87_05990 [Planctomycetes bacterium]|nr:hypothetical protein [Planctomycetota bacterium]